jgi:hypothetical protein
MPLAVAIAEEYTRGDDCRAVSDNVQTPGQLHVPLAAWNQFDKHDSASQSKIG